MSLLLAIVLAASPAQPELRRIAVVVGANAAPPGRATLKFAHRDASALAGVLTGLGRFAEEDVRVLLDPTPEAVVAALERASREASGMLFFYYSGHADAEALYPNGLRLPLAAVRGPLEQSTGRVRIGVLDACHGGGWTRTKGLEAAAPFDVGQALGLNNEGSVFIASSSGLENAHESDRLRGSFFTHHLVAGLRGAADASADGVITLTEAFDYAQQQTIRDTALQTREPQHPSFDMNLRGRQDMPLTELVRHPSGLRITQREGPLQLVELATGSILVELEPGPRELRLALPAGRYLLRKATALGIASKELRVAQGQDEAVDEAQLSPAGAVRLAAKSGRQSATLPAAVHEDALARRRFSAAFTAGLLHGVGPMSAVQPGVAFVQRSLGGGLLSTGGASAAVVWRITERLSWAIGTGALSYRFGDDARFGITPWAGLLAWGYGKPYDLAIDAYQQLFATLGFGADARVRLAPRHAITFGLRAQTSPTLARTQTVAPRETYRLRGTDSWTAQLTVGYLVELSDALRLHVQVAVAHSVLNQGRLQSFSVSEEPLAIGLGAVSGFGLSPSPLVSYALNEWVSVDGYWGLILEPMSAQSRLRMSVALGATLAF